MCACVCVCVCVRMHMYTLFSGSLPTPLILSWRVWVKVACSGCWFICTQFAGMLGMQDVNADQMSSKFDDMLTTIRQVNEQFKNAVSVLLFSPFLFLACYLDVPSPPPPSPLLVYLCSHRPPFILPVVIYPLPPRPLTLCLHLTSSLASLSSLSLTLCPCLCLCLSLYSYLALPSLFPPPPPSLHPITIYPPLPLHLVLCLCQFFILSTILHELYVMMRLYIYISDLFSLRSWRRKLHI